MKIQENFHQHHISKVPRIKQGNVSRLWHGMGSKTTDILMQLIPLQSLRISIMNFAGGRFCVYVMYKRFTLISKCLKEAWNACYA